LPPKREKKGNTFIVRRRPEFQITPDGTRLLGRKRERTNEDEEINHLCGSKGVICNNKRGGGAWGDMAKRRINWKANNWPVNTPA